LNNRPDSTHEMPPDAILTIRDLSLSFPTYGGFTSVLHHVSFSVKKGETLAIVGESGSCKTVTLRRVMSLLKNVRTDSGTITLKKRDGVIVDITDSQVPRPGKSAGWTCP
jgi:glutathione transport system ATP-binding protein